ncbi:MAG: alpha/beta fold hydrolase [Gammaproteobacteria bacterium]
MPAAATTLRRPRRFHLLPMGCVVVLALVLTGVAAHPLGPPPGRLVEVDGHRMHVFCRGHGAPTVVMDAGLGGASLEWQPVMQRVARFARVCVYDRAGYGWSDMGSYPRTSSIEVDELYLLLANAGIEGPFILAGHSFGGYNAQLFARRYAYLVAGLVLIDSSHPEQVERFQAPPYGVKTAPSSRFGLVQFGEMPPLHPNLSRQARLLTLYQHKHWKPRRAISYELLGFRDSAREVRSARNLPDVPLVVLTRGRRAWPATPQGDLLEQLWIDLQSELAAGSPEAAHLLVRGSGHMIHLEQPDMVAFGIALAIDAARRHLATADSPPVAARDFFGAISDAVWLRDSLGVPLPPARVTRVALRRAPFTGGG